MPVTFTTDLPDVDSLSLDASEAETITATWGDVTNNGEYRIELRDDDPDGDHPPYEHEATVAEDVTSHTIENILGGEQYSVRIRSQTDHVTGEWLAAEEITKLIASDNITFGNIEPASVDVQWTINNDFRGSHQVYRRRRDYDYDGDGWYLTGTAASDASSYTDDAVAPDRPYDYYVRTQTQWQYADSESASVDAADAGLAQSPTGSSGWHVEIDHPSGRTITPQVLDDAVVEPRLNEQPRVRIPVPRNERWLSGDLEVATMRVWQDSDRQPIDELEDVEIEPGQAVLIGVGGTQLERTVSADVSIREAHELARDLIEQETGYVANVDDPAITELTNEFLQETSTTGEFTDRARITDSDPFYVRDDGAVEQGQTLLLGDAADLDDITDTNTNRIDDSSLTDGGGRRLDTDGDYFEFNPQTLHFDIAEGDVGIAMRWTGSDDPIDARISIIDDADGSTLGSVDANGTSSAFDALWDYNSDALIDDWTDGDISAGDYRIRVESLGNSSDTGCDVDLVAVYDRRFYSDDFDNTLHESGGHLDGPRLYPAASPVEFDDVETIYTVRAGIVDSVFNDTSNNQAIAVSNDRGRNWLEASNTETLDKQFNEVGNTLRLRVTASACEPDGVRNTETPRYGYAPQRIESFELRADMDDTPLVINQPYDGDLLDALVDIADRSDSVLEVRQDGDQTTIEWCQPGQRSSVPAASVSDYTVTKRGSRTLKAVVKGGSASERETVTADASAPIDLSESDVIPGRESVRDADTGERYRYGYDYEINNLAGEIDLISGGDISDGQALEVEYDYKVSGEYAADAYDGDPRTETRETISEISTARGCQMAAKVLVDELSVPRWEADVQIPPGDLTDISLVEALDLEELPGESDVVYEVDNAPEGLSLRLGSRNRTSEAVENIRDRVSSASDRV